MDFVVFLNSQRQFLLEPEDSLNSVTDKDPLDPKSFLSTKFKDPLPHDHISIMFGGLLVKMKKVFTLVHTLSHVCYLGARRSLFS